jgi:hypothetical protein
MMLPMQKALATPAPMRGALMEHLEHDVLNQLQGAHITLERA